MRQLGVELFALCTRECAGEGLDDGLAAGSFRGNEKTTLDLESFSAQIRESFLANGVVILCCQGQMRITRDG